MARPGIMLYFDILEPIRVLPDADKGRLLVAMLEYGQSGIVPEFDGLLGLAWGFVKPKLDKDGESYEHATVQRKYAAFCKRRSALSLPKIPFAEWLDMSDDERERAATEDNEPKRAVDFVASRYPSTTTATSTSTATAATTSTTNAATADRNLEVMSKASVKDVIFLSDIQVNDLLNKLGKDTFAYYVERLADFITRNNAHVKCHYETILKWWEEDCAASKQSKHTTRRITGASGKLGPEELAAIQRLLSEE